MEGYLYYDGATSYEAAINFLIYRGALNTVKPR